MIFERANIYLDENLCSKDEVLHFLADKVAENGVTSEPSKILDGYMERETETTTGFGNGVAIPHTKSQHVLKPMILFLRSQNLIEWNSLDGKPVDSIISIVVPENSLNEHLKLLAQLSRQLVHQEFISILKNGTQEEIWNTISPIVNGDDLK